MFETDAKENTWPQLHLVVERFDFGEPEPEITAVCQNAEDAAAIASSLNAERGGQGSTWETMPVPFVSSLATARVEVLTISQDVHKNGDFGDYVERRHKVWAFEPGKMPAPVAGGKTDTGITFYGTDHDEVRTLFAEAMAYAAFTSRPDPQGDHDHDDPQGSC